MQRIEHEECCGEIDRRAARIDARQNDSTPRKRERETKMNTRTAFPRKKREKRGNQNRSGA
jgi:hypothetical protein